jgi:hypothetical protein
VPRLNRVPDPFRAVFCLLAGHLVLGLAHVAMLPPWEGFDETGHYSYVQQLADQWVVPRVDSSRMAADVDAYARIAPMPYANAPPFARDGALTYQTFFAGRADRVARAGAFIHGRPDAPRRYAAGRELNWLSMHPPLYYLVLTPVYRATRQLGWAAHLLSLRLASYLLAWSALVVGVWACATAPGSAGEGGRAASRWAMLGIALWPVLVPSWFPEMARLGNDSLSTLVLALAWLVTIRADPTGPSVGYSLTLGLLLGAGCLTKLYFLPVAVAFLGFWLVRAWSAGGVTALASAAGRLAVVPLVMAGVAGWWYFQNWRDYGVAFAGNEILLQERAGGLVGALARLSPWAAVKAPLVFVATLAWPGTWSLVRPPSAVIAPMVVIILFGAGAYVAALRRSPLAAPAWLPAWLAAWILAAFGYHAVIRAAVTGQGQPGHYLHFLAVAFGVALGLGLDAGWSRPGFRRVVAGLAVYAVLFAVAMTWAQVMLFSGWLFKAGATNIYRLPEAWPPLLGLPDALSRLATLAHPGVGASAWVIGGLLVVGGLRLAWASAPGTPRSGSDRLDAPPRREESFLDA